jgi:putative tryptophan/tyrosine transport system substrate-binding protein
VAYATPSIQAAMGATRTIPIVMATAGDALRTGLVSNLARPGANVTGLSLALIELAGKTVELLREVLPRVTRIACVVHTEDPLHRGFLSEAEVAAGRLGLHFRPVLLRSVGEMDVAFGSIVREGVGAVVVQPIFCRSSEPCDPRAAHSQAPITGGIRAEVLRRGRRPDSLYLGI